MKNINYSFVCLCSILGFNILSFAYKIEYSAFYWIITGTAILGIFVSVLKKEINIKK